MFWILFASIDTSLRALLFVSACGTWVASRVGDAFVDDSHLGVTSSHIDDPALSLEDNIRLHELQVVNDLGTLAQHYERLLWSTGGALNIGKCSWNLISWRWKNGRASLATSSQARAELRLTAGASSRRETVPRLQPYETYRTLGVFINGKGCMRQPRKILRGKSAEFAGRIAASSINAVSAYFANSLYYSPKIGYSLPVTTLSFKDCGYIQAPTLMAILPKLKINRNTARAIIHGPHKYGGLQMAHAYAEQGHGQLRLLLIRIALSYLQMTVGSTRLCLNLPFAPYTKWVERTWLTSLWEFLERTRLSVDIRQAWCPKLQREGDATIMSIFIAGGYGGSELAQLNRCRLFHQVFFISDIATANGRQIDNKYRRAVQNNERRSKWKWPYQGIPDRTAWRLWDQALTYLEQFGKLRVQLGGWLIDPHQEWEWRFDFDEQAVVQVVDGRYRVYYPMVKSRTGSSSQLYSLDSYSELYERELESWAVATPIFLDVGDTLFTIQISGQMGREPVTIDPSPRDLFSSLQDHIGNAPEFFSRLIGPLPSLTDAMLEAIGLYIQEGSLLTCSDGSTDPELGTSCQAWVFSDKDGHLL